MPHYVLKELTGLHEWREVRRFEALPTELAKIVKASGVAGAVVEQVAAPVVEHVEAVEHVEPPKKRGRPAR